MIISINKDTIYNYFNVDAFSNLEEVLENTAPSMVEYYLEELLKYGDEEIYLNKREIQNSIHIDKYSIIEDYSNNIYLECKKINKIEAQSLW